MKFVDIAKIYIKSGDGGPGHISFRKEKYVPKGGPDGGNGGKGGDVVFKVDPHMNTLLDFKFKLHYKAQNGDEGGKSNKTGKDGEDVIIRVPNGTLIKNAETEVIIYDLTDITEDYILAEGGKGGRGNAEFATPTNQAPRYADPGRPGIEMEIILELKLIADVGIIGFPNAGKSTLISVISASKPKIADYPFTTLVPNLGIVRVGTKDSFTIADMPGLIEGASDGKGLGIQFLRHIERTRILVFLIDCMSENPLSEYQILNYELAKYNADLEKKEKIICLSKIDVLDIESKKGLKKINFNYDKEMVLLISSVSGEGLEDLKRIILNKLNKSI